MLARGSRLAEYNLVGAGLRLQRASEMIARISTGCQVRLGWHRAL